MKRGIFVIFLVCILLISTISYNYTAYFVSNKNIHLPKERILSRLDEKERDLLIRLGYTIIYYNFSSEERDENLEYLKNILREKPVVLVLNFDSNKIVIESLKGKREKVSPSLNETIDMICEIMIDAPLECVLREIE